MLQFKISCVTLHLLALNNQHSFSCFFFSVRLADEFNLGSDNFNIVARLFCKLLWFASTISGLMQKLATHYRLLDQESSCEAAAAHWCQEQPYTGIHPFVVAAHEQCLILCAFSW